MRVKELLEQIQRNAGFNHEMEVEFHVDIEFSIDTVADSHKSYTTVKCCDVEVSTHHPKVLTIALK
jgi:hypothetical protein